MINMLKVLIAVYILLMILAFAMLGRDLKQWFVFRIVKKSPIESTWIMSMATVLVIGLCLADFIKNNPPVNVLMVIGLAIFFVGAWMQIFIKKRQPEILQERMEKAFNRVTTIGYYSKIRHPSKLACLLMLFGLCLAMKSGWGIIVLITLYLPSLFFKMHQEERVLLDEYGDRYFAYQDRTKKLVPKLI